MSELLLNFTDGSQMELNQHNTSLYTFLGEIALRDEVFDAARFNHIFVETDDFDEDTQASSGFHIFSDHATFQPVMHHIVKNNWPMHLNLRRVAPGDRKAYFDSLDKKASKEAGEIGDFIPEDWE